MLRYHLINILVALFLFIIRQISTTVYQSEDELVAGTENDVLIFSVSTIFGCALKCLENQCYRTTFNETEHICYLKGTVISPSTAGSSIKVRRYSEPLCENEVKIVNQTFTTDSSSTNGAYYASYGIDGDVTTFFTSTIEPNPWWSVDLQQNYNVTMINAIVRSSLRFRFGMITIYLSPVPEPDSAKFKKLPIFDVLMENVVPTSSWTFKHPAGILSGRYLYIQMAKDTDKLEFIELEIYKCIN